MNVEAYIKENIPKIMTNMCKAFIAPNIPDKKLNNALKEIAPGIRVEYVLALIDTTILGSGKTGFVFIGDKVYINNNNFRLVIEYKDLTSVEIQKQVNLDSKGKQYITSNVILHKKNGQNEIISPVLQYINAEGFADLMNGILAEAGDGEEEFETSNQTCPLAMMSREVKETYLKLICNYCYSDDDIIDASEYAAIISLIVINDFDKESRLHMREYMNTLDNTESTDLLLHTLFANSDQNAIDNLRLSLMKDLLHLHWEKKHDNDWKSDEGLINYKDKLELDDQKIDYLMNSIVANEEILTNRQSDIQIKKTMQDLASTSAAMGIPLAAIYLSGSVVGVSAAGMTSGLAALGMGGVLGFSSMFTGIGVAVLLGVGAYRGVKKMTGLGDLEKNKQREMMLQQIARNSQKALTFLIEDVNDLTTQLQTAIVNGETNSLKIKKLSTMLLRMSQSAKQTSAQMDYAAKEKIICHMPVSINPSHIEELIPGPVHQTTREFILNCYNQKLVTDSGAVIEHYINWNLPLSSIEKLDDILREIGFYNVADTGLASAKSTAKNLLKGFTGQGE